jgi:hypothetical protein
MIEGEFCISILTFFLFCWWEINAGPFFMGLITVAHVTISKRIKPRGTTVMSWIYLDPLLSGKLDNCSFSSKKKRKKKRQLQLPELSILAHWTSLTSNLYRWILLSLLLFFCMKLKPLMILNFTMWTLTN